MDPRDLMAKPIRALHISIMTMPLDCAIQSSQFQQEPNVFWNLESNCFLPIQSKILTESFLNIKVLFRIIDSALSNRTIHKFTGPGH